MDLTQKSNENKLTIEEMRLLDVMRRAMRYRHSQVIVHFQDGRAQSVEITDKIRLTGDPRG